MEKDILYTAIENFNIHSNLNLVLNEFIDCAPKNEYDGVLILNSNLQEFEFEFIVKNKLTLAKLLAIDNYFKNKND